MSKEPFLLASCWLLALLSSFENGAYTFLRDVGERLSDCTVHISDDGNFNSYRSENSKSTTSYN
jgi:hypothetical protein